MKQLGGLILAALVIATWGSSSARAAFITVLEDNGNVFTDKTDDPSELDFDIEWFNIQPVSLQITLIPDGSPEAIFSSEHTNSGPDLWTDFHVNLEGAAWSEINGVLPSPLNVTSTSTEASLFFDPTTFVTIGTAGSPDPTDWVIDVTGVQNFTFQMHLQPSISTVIEPTVPEPSTFVLLGIGGIAVIGYGLRRKRQRAA